MTKGLVFAAAAALLASVLPASALPLPKACATPDDSLKVAGSFESSIKELTADKSLDILAIGSSSTAGVGASDPSKAYTARLEAELEARLPDVAVTVEARGINGETADMTAARMQREVASLDPDLVLWQVGTNDAARGVDLVSFTTTLTTTIDELLTDKVDVVLLDPQFAPGRDAGYGPYLTAIDKVAGRERVPVIHRFAAMQQWGDPDAGPARGLLWKDGFHMSDLGHGCTGAMIAEALARGISAARATATR